MPSTDMRGAAAASSSAASTPHASWMPELLCRCVIVAASDILDRDVRKETNPAGCLSKANASVAELDDREESDESGLWVSAKRPKPPSKPPRSPRARSAVFP